MARFKADVEGGRGPASRVAHHRIVARAYSWRCGVRTELHNIGGNRADSEVTVTIQLTPNPVRGGAPDVVLLEIPESLATEYLSCDPETQGSISHRLHAMIFDAVVEKRVADSKAVRDAS